MGVKSQSKKRKHNLDDLLYRPGETEQGPKEYYLRVDKWKYPSHFSFKN